MRREGIRCINSTTQVDRGNRHHHPARAQDRAPRLLLQLAAETPRRGRSPPPRRRSAIRRPARSEWSTLSSACRSSFRADAPALRRRRSSPACPPASLRPAAIPPRGTVQSRVPSKRGERRAALPGWIASAKCPPMPARSACGDHGSAQAWSSTTLPMPNAAALRRIAPTLPGSWTPSRNTTSSLPSPSAAGISISAAMPGGVSASTIERNTPSDTTTGFVPAQVRRSPFGQRLLGDEDRDRLVPAAAERGQQVRSFDQRALLGFAGSAHRCASFAQCLTFGLSFEVEDAHAAQVRKPQKMSARSGV